MTRGKKGIPPLKGEAVPTIFSYTPEKIVRQASIELAIILKIRQITLKMSRSNGLSCLAASRLSVQKNNNNNKEKAQARVGFVYNFHVE